MSRVPPVSPRAVMGLVLALAAGVVVLVVMFHLVDGHHTTALDARAFDVLAGSPGGLLARVAKPAEVILPLLLALAGLVLLVPLVRRRAWAYGLIVVVGFPLTLVAAHVAKAADQRARPLGGLLYAGGYSFPSTDSALAVGVLAMALVAAQLTSDRRHRVWLVIAGALLTLGAGLLFIALRVHYVSDVIAGWALGVAVFSFVALVVTAAAWILTAATSRRSRDAGTSTSHAGPA